MCSLLNPKALQFSLQGNTHSQGEPMKQKIKFTSNCMAHGKAYQAGTIASLDKATAEMLCRLGRAQIETKKK